MGIVEPEHRAIPGRHAPVVAHAGAPVGIVEPPFGRDAFGAEGGAGVERAAAPGEAGGNVGGVLRPDRFGAEQREGPGAGRARPVGGALRPGGGERRGGFLGDVAVGGAGAGDRLQPHAGADPGDEVGHGLILATRARGLGADGPAALVLGGVQRFGQGRGEAQAVDAEARVDVAGLEREEGAELVGAVGGAGEADLQHLRVAIDARQLQPHAPGAASLARGACRRARGRGGRDPRGCHPPARWAPAG
jgi:hypothetical protein